MEKRKHIIDVATKMYKRFGIKKTTVEDIAKECRLTTSALYYYFKNKDDITREVFVKILEEKNENIYRKMEHAKEKPLEKLEIFIKNTLNIHLKALNDFSFDLLDFAEQFDVIKSVHDIDSKNQIELISSILKQGLEKNIFSVDDVNESAESIFLIVEGFSRMFMEIESNDKINKMIDNMCTIVIKGLKI